jgi:hypothetical protein
MAETVTDIIIDASADRVWETVADLPAYPNWNPVLRHVRGELTPHKALTVVRVSADGGEITEHATVVLYRPGREIRWRTRALLPWLLDVEHTFKIEPLGRDQVRFVHWLSRSGLLAYLLPQNSEAAIRDQLDVMNLALKAQVEHGLAPAPESATARDDRAARSLRAPAAPEQQVAASSV